MTDLPIPPARVADLLECLRERRPRVHCITNAVAQAYSANMLLALGVSPSMTITPEEIPDFVAHADALLVNLGTLDAERRNAIETAIEVAKEMGRPWLLDPVKVNVSVPRATFARKLLDREPAIIRLNAREFAALAEGAADAAAITGFALRSLSVVALSGEIDIVTDGTHMATVSNGHELMTRTTAIGCAGTAVMAAFCTVEPDPVIAAAAALTVMGVAGEVAAESAAGPGSFSVGLIDALYRLDATTLMKKARLT